MSWGGLDQRAFPRLNAECRIHIDHGKGAIKAHTENIGMGGACVILNQELPKLSEIQFSIVLSEREPPIECGGRIVWAVRSKNPASGKVSFDTGIEFLNLTDEQKSSLEHFVESAS